MPKKLVYLHTVASLAPTFKALSDELLEDVEIFHMVDETLLQNTIRANQLSKNTIRRLIGHLASAQEAGADLVMVTCSSVGPAVDLGQKIIDIPVFRVDQPMADLAVETGANIGVAATLSTTLEPTADLIERRAAAAGKDIRVISKLCEGAFDAVISGDTATHDQIVSAGLKELVEASDVIVLAQASMARVVQGLPEEDRRVPILSSPRLAVENLAKVIPTL